MLRFMIALLFAVAAGGTAVGADRTVARHGWRGATARLPAGLPRAHYHFRTTISYGARYGYRRAYTPRLSSVYETPGLLYAPDYAVIPYIQPLAVAPLLQSGFPGYYGTTYGYGYYGTTYSYDYQGSYYGGPYVGYGDRLPYACGVYGYC
jgi:hypothetical protein